MSENQGEARTVLLATVKKLRGVLEGTRASLSMEEQLHFCYCLDEVGPGWTDSHVLRQILGVLESFRESESRRREKCFIELLFLREKVDNLVLLAEIRPIANLDVD